MARAGTGRRDRQLKPLANPHTYAAVKVEAYATVFNDKRLAQTPEHAVLRHSRTVNLAFTRHDTSVQFKDDFKTDNHLARCTMRKCRWLAPSVSFSAVKA